MANEITEIDDKQGRIYFEGSLAFQATLNSILATLVRRVRRLAAEDISGANTRQIWGVILLIFIMALSPILIKLSSNAISSIQLFAGENLLHFFFLERFIKHKHIDISKEWQCISVL